MRAGGAFGRLCLRPPAAGAASGSRVQAAAEPAIQALQNSRTHLPALDTAHFSLWKRWKLAATLLPSLTPQNIVGPAGFWRVEPRGLSISPHALWVAVIASGTQPKSTAEQRNSSHDTANCTAIEMYV